VTSGAPAEPGDPPYRWGERLERVVRRRAAETPDAVAVQQGGTTVSYGELIDRSDRVAGGLRRRGVREGDLVPLLLPRSPELVVTMLAVLRAGAAYAAIDPGWPRARVDQVVRRCRVGGAVETVDGLDAVDELARSSEQPLPDLSDGTVPACVFFTSGSSGAPKGVLSPHRGSIRVVVENPRIPLDEQTVLLQAAPLPWDAMSLELWGALLNGGRCVLLGRDRAVADAASIEEAIRVGVNTLWLTSSLFNSVVEHVPRLFEPIRLLMLGGERLSVAHVRTVLENAPATQVINGYGPVETTIFATTHTITDDDVRADGEIPIGDPVPRTEVLLLADDGTPTSPPADPDDPAELAVAGDGLALGYLDDPAETKRRFVVRDGVRYYRTGDLVTLDGHGRLLFRGRNDRQVKIRGVRLELGEIETVLEAHPGVGSARALALPDDHGSLVVAAAYTTTDERVLPDRLLREHAAEALLPGVVPGLLVHVDRFPTGTTGKVDTRALEARMREALTGGQPPPSYSADPALAEMSGVLRLPGLRPDDDLFDRGATSLDAVRVAAWLTARLGRSLTVGEVYEGRTFRRLWAADDRSDSRLVRGEETRTPLSHAQQRFWLAEQTHPGLADNMVVSAFVLTGAVRRDALKDALRDVLDRHSVLRDRYVWRSDGPCEEARPTERDLVEVVEEDRAGRSHRHAAEDCVASWWETPLDLESGPPLRIRLVVLDDGTHLLCLQIHHIAFDGWSEQVFLDDLVAAYDARSAGRVDRRPAPYSYADYSRWEASRVEGWAREEFPFWRELLAEPPEPAFPAGHGAPEGPRGEIVSEIAAPVVAGLQAASARRGAPAVATIATATASAMGTVFGASDLNVGTVDPGRRHLSTHDVVGYFVNPVVVPLHGVTSDPAELLGRGAEAVRAALHHARTPFDELVRRLSPSRARNPWFQTFTVMQHPVRSRTSHDGVHVSRLRLRPPRTAIELMVEAFPRADGGWDLVTLWRRDSVTVDPAIPALVSAMTARLDELAIAARR